MPSDKTLQSHYEVVHHGRTVSVPREELTIEELEAIAAKLRADVDADFRHAGILEIALDHRRRRGVVIDILDARVDQLLAHPTKSTTTAQDLAQMSDELLT